MQQAVELAGIMGRRMRPASAAPASVDELARIIVFMACYGLVVSDGISDFGLVAEETDREGEP